MDSVDVERAEAILDRARYPVCSIAGPRDDLEAAAAVLDARLRAQDYRRKEPEHPSPSAHLYERGGRGRSALAVTADALAQEGGSQFNLKLHVVLEPTSPTELLFSVHGVDHTLRAPFDPEEEFGEALDAATDAMPAVERGPWFGAGALPPHLASSPGGFRALLGPVGAFWWS